MKEKLIKAVWCEISEFDEMPGNSGMHLTSYNIEGIDESEVDEIMRDDYYFRSLDIVKDILTRRYKNAIEYDTERIEEFSKIIESHKNSIKYYTKRIEEVSKIEEKDLYQTESYKEYLKSKLQAV